MLPKERILVTGGAGYVGSLLVPALINKGYKVTVLDWFIFEPELFCDIKSDQLTVLKGDIRNEELVKETLSTTDSVIQLAGMSNDPSAVLDPQATEDINYKATVNLAKIAKELGVKRMIIASSASVYGIQDKIATEETECKPLTIYSKCKLRSEEEILPLNDNNFIATAVRPATLSGFAPRLRLDLVVNNMSSQAAFSGKLKVYGGEQYRPNLSVTDMVKVYLTLLEQDGKIIGGKAYNVGESNLTIMEIVKKISTAMDKRKLVIDKYDSDDKRSYWINSDKAKKEWGFKPTHTVNDSIKEIINAVVQKNIPDINLAKFKNASILKDRDLSLILK
jgi:nucleoside-diphosphate-sugar epimerase